MQKHQREQHWHFQWNYKTNYEQKRGNQQVRNIQQLSE
jgi:hypothetical protein